MSTPASTQPPIVATSQGSPARPWLGNGDWIATVWMLGGLFCVTLAAVMHVGENRGVYFPGSSAPIPELCTLYSRFGIDCPGCGLTRTFIHMAHGQLGSAWQTNPVGMLVFLFACLQIPMGAAQVIFRMRNSFVEAWGSWNDWCTAGLLIALLLQWAIRFAISL